MSEASQAIVIDNGSYTIKSGFAGDDAPRAIFSTVIGRPKKGNNTTKNVYIGNEAQSKRDILFVKYPIWEGIITSFDDMEQIWKYTFYTELRIEPEEHSVLLTEQPLNPKYNREKITKIMFETFNIPSMYISCDAVLSLYSSGRTSGLILDSGNDLTRIVPIYEGYKVQKGIFNYLIAGKNITEYLMKLMIDKNYDINNYKGKEIIIEIKEKLGYLALNYENELKKDIKLEKNYELPDEKIINIEQEIFKCTEILFKPNKQINKEGDKFGIHEATFRCIKKCDVDIRKSLYENIVLSGGNSLLKNFDIRYNNELVNIVNNSKLNIKVIATPERKYSTWIGGSILASLSNFKEMWISKDEYDEFGPGIVHRKCF